MHDVGTSLTELLDLLLVGFAGNNALFGGLGLLDGLFDGDEPSIALSSGGSLESVLVAVKLEVEREDTILAQFRRIGLESVLENVLRDANRGHVDAYQVQNTSRSLFLIGVLDEEQQSLAGDAGPSSSRVGDIGLLATKILGEAGGGNGGLLTEPEVLFGETEDAIARLAILI